MTLDEVKASAHRGVNAAGTVSYWLQPKTYALGEFLEAWERLGSPHGEADTSAEPMAEE